MHINLAWKGRDHESLENCLVNISTKGTYVDSVIVGKQGKKIYRASYRISTNAQWETVLVELDLRIGKKEISLRFKSDGKGNWTSGGKKQPKFKGCIDVDLPLTPFTNTLPIRRLHLKKGESREINVLYLDVLNGEIKALKQRYKKLAANKYMYQNVPNDFEAKIEVDKYGLVKDYPGLFVRKGKVEL